MIKELLLEKGFVEGVDYSLSGNTLTALEKTRPVEQIIHHVAIPPILGSEGDVVVEGTPAWDEIIIVDETYTENIPSLQSLKLELIRRHDAAALVGAFLEGKQTTENDSVNVDLFLSGGPGWRFEFTPPPSIDDLYSLIPTVKAKIEAQQVKETRIARGAADRAKCQNVLDLIAGYNRERALSIPQITQMQQTFAQAESLLRASRPDFAKQAIQAIQPDGVLVTEQMKQDALDLLA